MVRKEKEAKATKAEKTEEIMTLMALLRAGHLTSPEFERALVMLME